jgi:hypothetical protein
MDQCSSEKPSEYVTTIFVRWLYAVGGDKDRGADVVDNDSGSPGFLIGHDFLIQSQDFKHGFENVGVIDRALTI